MTPWRSLLALLVCTTVGLGAELRTLTGTKVTGDLVSLDGKEVVIKTATGPVATPLPQVLQIDVAPAITLGRDTRYTDVELTDGTLLHCSQFSLKGKQVEMTLLSGQQLKLPLDAVNYVLNEANDDANRAAWKERFLSAKPSSDLLGIKSADGQLNSLKGTFGVGDEEGKTIEFDLNTAGKPRPLKLDRVHGMLFLRELAANAAPVLCRLHDTHQNVLMVSSVKQTDAGFSIETPAGARLVYAKERVARFDFSRGKLAYLSALEPAKVVENSTEERVEHYRKNVNLDGSKIRLRLKDEKAPNGFVVQSYDVGLSLHAYTELEYELKGEYNEFKAVVGVDETVGGTDGPVLLKVEGDGKELLTLTLTRKDEAKPVALNIKNVNRLRITVSSGDVLDLGRHLTLADARVSK